MSTKFLGDPGEPRARRLQGKVAIITGAGSRPAGTEQPILGNGKAMAIMFAREGAQVVILDGQLEWAAETQKIVEQEGGESILVEADVSEEASCRAAVEKTVETFG
jgi:NAD(P)-dependent dehydrogenase (short-subunit alcohol dehydrogenase family)